MIMLFGNMAIIYKEIAERLYKCLSLRRRTRRWGDMGQRTTAFLYRLSLVQFGLYTKHTYDFIKLNSQSETILEHHGVFLRKRKNYKGKQKY